jgi:hypothetical protein
MVDPAFPATAALLLALVLAVGAFEKARDIDRFEGAVAQYQLTPPAIARAFAFAFTGGESLAALALLVPMTRLAGGALALILLACATLAIAVNLARGRRDIDCGCGGGTIPLTTALLARNGILLALGGIVFAPAAPRALGVLDHLHIVLAALVGAGLYFVGNQLIANGAAARRLEA